MAAGAEGAGGGGMLSGLQSGLTSAFSGGAMSNATIEEQRKFAGESITKAFDAFGGMQANAATGKATATPSAWSNETSATPMNAYPGASAGNQPFQPIDPTGTLYWWLPQQGRA
jgi:hypothetical protein